jgi:hypothetical protein
LYQSHARPGSTRPGKLKEISKQFLSGARKGPEGESILFFSAISIAVFFHVSSGLNAVVREAILAASDAVLNEPVDPGHKGVPFWGNRAVRRSYKASTIQ